MVQVDTSSAEAVRDLASFRRDMEIAKAYGEAFIASDPATIESPRDLRLAYWVAAVTTYARSFGTGARRSENRPSVEAFTDEQRAAHDLYIELRNKHIAHAVNAFEQTQPFAIITDSGLMRRGITRVGQAHMEIVDTDVEPVRGLVELCNIQIADLQRRLTEANARVMVELYELGEDAVYALPPLAPPPVSKTRVDKRRR